jgi:TolB-like protein/Flp pilus assembly protein TadD
MTNPTLLQRLKERKLVQWALAYLAGAFVVFQAVEVMAEPWGISPSLQRAVHIVLLFGLLVTLVLAWYHGEKGRQRVSGPELLMVAALLVVAGVALSTLGGGEEAPGPVEATASGETEDARPSLAVLPLDNNSPDPQDAFFANQVHADIISALSKISSLSVKGRSSVDQFREERPPIREIATRLGVHFLLEGTAQIAGSLVRVSVQLIDGSIDEVLWDKDWQVEYLPAEAIRIQVEIAEGVASELSVVIAPEEQTRLASVATEDPEALRLYQVGRYLWNQRTEPETHEAIRLLQEAVTRDPMFAEAHAALADALLMLANYSWALPDEVYPEAIAAAERALELNPTLAAAQATRGFVSLIAWDWEGAEEYWRRALALDPDHAYARYWYSVLLQSLGRMDEAREQATLAIELDPLAPQIRSGLITHYNASWQFDRAIAEGLRLVRSYPDFENGWSYLASAYTGAGRFEEALDALERKEEIEGDNSGFGLAEVLAHQGDRNGALEEVARIRERWGLDRINLKWAAEVYVILGDYDEAFRLLHRARDMRSASLRTIGWEFNFHPVRSDPRFIALMEELKLPIVEHQ